MMTKISKIKLENIFFLLWIPLAIDQIIRANENSKGLAIIIEGIFLFGIYFTTKEMRKEFKENASKLDEIIQETLQELLQKIDTIKKETYSKAKSIYHKRNASKSLSYSIINQNS